MDVNRMVLACGGGETRSSNEGHEELGGHYSNPPETPDEQRRFRFRPERQRVPPCSSPPKEKSCDRRISVVASRSNSLELESLLRRGRIGPARVERTHKEGVAAGGEARVGLGRAAAREMWVRLLVLLDERALKARGLAARVELELSPVIGLVDLRLGDVRVRRQEREAGRDRPICRQLHPAAAAARAGTR